MDAMEKVASNHAGQLPILWGTRLAHQRQIDGRRKKGTRVGRGVSNFDVPR